MISISLKYLFVLLPAILLTACGAKAPKTQSAKTLLPNTTAAEAEEILNQEISGEISVSCYSDNAFFLNPAIEAFRLK